MRDLVLGHEPFVDITSFSAWRFERRPDRSKYNVV
jgi:hypothetical protein